MIFTSESMSDFKKIITEGIAYGVFLYPDAFNKDVDGNHISTKLFQDPPHIHQTTLKFISSSIENAKTKSIIGFTENDPFLISIATQVSYSLKMPFYPYDLENDSSADSKFVRPEVVPCSLIIPYSINQNHVNEVIERFSQQKVPISQVISLIDENPTKTTFPHQDFEFVSICDWISLQDRIKQFKNLTNEKMQELLANFD